MHSRVVALFMLVSLTPSCFMGRTRLNEPLVKDHIAQLVPGKSTATEVANQLGAPAEVVQLGHGMAWRYEFTVSKSAGLFLLIVGFYNEDTRSDRCWLFFDQNRTLTHVGTTLRADSAEYSMPWSDVHE